jgi:AraC-like DNA-binding protein
MGNSCASELVYNAESGNKNEAELSGERNGSPIVTIKNAPEQGMLCKTELRSGLWLNVMDIQPEKALMLKFEKKAPYIDFGFVLAGNVKRRFRSASTDSMELNNKAGGGGVLFLPESEGIVEIPARKRLLILHIHVKPQVLHSLLQDELAIAPSDLKPILEGSTHKEYVYLGETDPTVHTVAHQILRPPFTTMPKRLFLEAKALELISLQISCLLSRKGQPRKKSALSPNERDLLYAVREMLMQNMESPPNLAELSQQYRLSVNKLEFGFRELFGTTVFGFLKEYKMQKARLFFEEGEMNVSQVAWEVGYVNVSHFCAAYKKRFGIQPKRYLQLVRTRKVAC